MKKLVLESTGTLALVEAAPPVPGIDEELLTVELAGIGGSEYLGFANPGIRNLPNAMAHGILGTTAAARRVAVYPITGCEQCKHCQNGSVQLCAQWQMIGVHTDGGFSQQLALRKHALVNIPDSLSWEQAAFIEPFANSVNAIDLSGVTMDSNVAIIGAGGLGLGVVAGCASIGCTTVSVTDPSKPRLEAAQYLGGTFIKRLETDRFDVVFDTVGTDASRASAIAATNTLGTTVLLGFAQPQIELDAGSFIRSQKRMIGAFAYSKKQFTRAISLAEKTNAEWVNNLSFHDVELQLKEFLAGNFETIKAVLRPNQ